MKKFQFTMQKILDLKQNMLDAEKNRLGQLRERKARIEAEIDALRQSAQEIADEMRAAQIKGVTVAELIGFSTRRENIRLQLEELAGRLAEVDRCVEKQLQIVVAASQEVSKFEKIEQKQREHYRELEKKMEAARVEELVVTNIGRRSAAS